MGPHSPSGSEESARQQGYHLPGRSLDAYGGAAAERPPGEMPIVVSIMNRVHLCAQRGDRPQAANMSLSNRYGRTDDELAAIQPALREGYFSGKVVLISGAGSGIGRALAHWAARLGAEVVLCGRDAAKLKDAAAAIGRYGARTMVHALTIRDPDAVAELFDIAWGQFGRVDVLINNAGG